MVKSHCFAAGSLPTFASAVQGTLLEECGDILNTVVNFGVGAPKPIRSRRRPQDPLRCRPAKLDKLDSRNLKTLWKEAEKLVGTNSVAQALDPLGVIETIMRYFYSLAEARKESGGTIGEVIGYYKEAARLAALAAPYRHGRLSAIKLLGDPNVGAGPFKADATLEELRAELRKRVLAMAQAGLIDVASLPQPEVPSSATAAQSVGQSVSPDEISRTFRRSSARSY